MTSRLDLRGWAGLILGGALMSVAAQPAAALDFSKHAKDDATTNAILVKGRIVDGDSHDFKRYFAKLPKKPNTVVYLESPGGNVQQSMELGKFFYQNKIVTRVEARKVCASACAIAFLGGRNAEGKPERIKSSTARLGLHSFSREFPDDRRYSSDDMKELLQRAQTQVGVITEYVRSVEANPDVMRVMLTATHSQMNFIDNDDAIALGFQVFDEKTQAFVDPAPVLERIAKKRAEERIKAANTPAVTPDDDDTPARPSRRRVTTTSPAPAAGGSDSPSMTPPTTTTVRREMPRDLRRSTTGRHTGMAESGTR